MPEVTQWYWRRKTSLINIFIKVDESTLISHIPVGKSSAISRALKVLQDSWIETGLCFPFSLLRLDFLAKHQIHRTVNCAICFTCSSTLGKVHLDKVSA